MNRQLAITVAVTLMSVAASSCGVQNPKSHETRHEPIERFAAVGIHIRFD